MISKPTHKQTNKNKNQEGELFQFNQRCVSRECSNKELTGLHTVSSRKFTVTRAQTQISGFLFKTHRQDALLNNNDSLSGHSCCSRRHKQLCVYVHACVCVWANNITCHIKRYRLKSNLTHGSAVCLHLHPLMFYGTIVDSDALTEAIMLLCLCAEPVNCRAN